jgi:hypothetical protein
VSPTACSTRPGAEVFARPTRSKLRASFGNVLGVHSNSPGSPAARDRGVPELEVPPVAAFDQYSPVFIGNGTRVTFALRPAVWSTQPDPLGSTVSGRPAVPSTPNSRSNAYAVSANTDDARRSGAAMTTLRRRSSPASNTSTAATIATRSGTSAHPEPPELSPQVTVDDRDRRIDVELVEDRKLRRESPTTSTASGTASAHRGGSHLASAARTR